MGRSAGAGIIHVHVEDGPDRSANRRRLTPRQLDVLRIRAMGMSNAQTAEALGMAVQTVKNHQSQAHTRLNVSDLVQAMNAMGWVKVS